MSDPEVPAPGRRPRREPADPLQMPLAEKLACEWEARHDVIARGRLTDAAPVQHYLTHTRCEEGLHPHAHRAAHRPAPRAPRDASVPPALRGWLRWGDDGR